MSNEPPHGRPRDAMNTFLEELYRKYIELPAGAGSRPVPGDALVVGRDPVNEVPRYFTPDDLFLHLHAIGSWGSGKSNFLRRFCHQLVRRKRKTGCGFALIDPHGDAAEYVLALIASQAPALAPEVFYLDFSNTNPVLGIDPLRVYEQDQGAYYTACAAAEATLKAFGAMNSQDLPQLRRVLVALFEALIYTGLSVSDARYFLLSGDSDRAVLRGVLDRLPLEGIPGVTRGFWEHYLKQPPHMADSYASPPLNRLDPLMKTPVLKRLVSGATIGLDVKELMDRGGIGIFNLSLGKGAGVTIDAQHLFAAMLVQQFRQVIPQRTPNKAKPFTLVLDEFGDYCPADFARVLTGSRKFRVGIVFAHQNLGQLITKDQDRTLIETALMIPNRIVFGGLPIDEAKLLAQQMYLAELDPEAIKYWPETVTWDPMPTKVVNYGESSSGSETRSEGGSAGEGGGDVDSQSVSTDPETGDAVGNQAGSARSSSWNRSSQWSFSSSTSWSKTAQEAWVTFYKERIQKGTPVYRQIDEQVFTFARDLVLAPVGQGVLTRRGERPVKCRVPHMKDIEYTDDDIAAFLEEMYAKEQYRLPADVDELLVARERKLLEFTDPQIVPGEDEPAVRRPRATAGRRSGRRASAESAVTSTPRETTLTTEPPSGQRPIAEDTATLRPLIEANLSDAEAIIDHLDRAEDHEASGRWIEAITGYRTVLEGVLKAVAQEHARRTGGDPPMGRWATRELLKYLENAGLLDKRRRELVATIYGSHSDHVHGTVATGEDARLARDLTSSSCRFVLEKFGTIGKS